MAEIGAGIIGAGGAAARLVQRPRVLDVAGIHDVDLASPRERLAGTPRTGRQHAVEHVDAARNGADDVGGITGAHEISRLILGQRRHRRLQGAQHQLLSLADGKPADGVTIEA